MSDNADLLIESHGTLVLVQPVSNRGRAWLAEHCPEGDDHTFVGDALIIEYRYAASLAEGAAADGLLVS